ncbi:MAG: hypothetical protein ABWY20_18370, partial [Mycobacterium sp.]
HHERPQLNVPTQDSRWFLLCTVDGVTVTTADSRGVVYRQRDRAKMFALLRESLRRHRKHARRFDEMRKVNPEAQPVLSGVQQWEAVFVPRGHEQGAHTRSVGDDQGESVETPAHG